MSRPDTPPKSSKESPSAPPRKRTVEEIWAEMDDRETEKALETHRMLREDQAAAKKKG